MTHKLANLAKRLGYTIMTVNIFDNHSVIRVSKAGRTSIYEPINNLAQQDELQNEFKISVYWVDDLGIWLASYYQDGSLKIRDNGETIGGAVTNCAIKAMENEDGA